VMVPRASQRPRESWVATHQPRCTTTSESQHIKTQKVARGKDVGPTHGFASSPEVGPGATVGTLRTGYPRVQASSQDNGSRLLAEGSSEAATCPRGLGSRSQLGAAPGLPRVAAARAPAPSSGQLRARHVSPRLELPLPARGSSRAAMCPGALRAAGK
jgi:hypothetical protein